MLSDPRLRQTQAILGIILQTVEDIDSPLTASERIGSGSKPGSKPPGDMQCPWLTDRVLRIMERAAASAYAAIEISKPREHHTHVTSIGGKSLTPEDVKRQARVVQHLARRYGGGA